MFKPDRTNGFDVQSEVDAYAEEELNRPKQLTAKARLVNILHVVMASHHWQLLKFLCGLDDVHKHKIFLLMGVLLVGNSLTYNCR